VFGEMMIREALMPGVTDADQVARIWNYRGTPEPDLEERWQHLQNWKTLRPQAPNPPRMREAIEKLLIER
jgi:hypothetical protein